MQCGASILNCPGHAAYYIQCIYSLLTRYLHYIQHDLAELYITHIETPRTKLVTAVMESLGDFIQQTAHALRPPALDALVTTLWRR